MSSWPRLSMDGPSGTCPFDVTVSRDKNINKNSPEAHQAKGKQRRFDVPRDKQSPEPHPSRTKQRLVEKEVTVVTPIQRSARH